MDTPGSLPPSTCSDLQPRGSSEAPSMETTDSTYPPRPDRSSTTSPASVSAGFDEDRPRLPIAPSRSSSIDSHAGAAPLDPLSRRYPKPLAVINVAEALAREPHKWSLGYWVKNAKDMQDFAPSKEARARKFEEAKKELLTAKVDIARLPMSRR